MKTILKIILSMPSFLWFALIFYKFNSEKNKAMIELNQMINFQIAVIIISLLCAIMLLYRVWSFKLLDSSLKTRWTLILLTLFPISSLFYIWIQDDRFEKYSKEINLIK